MSCGGRVYKGDTVTISVPFDVSGYTNLSITYSTIGDEKIVLGQDEVEIEDGFITYTFSGHELDILPDGVIYYTIDCEVEGEDYVVSTNTPLYLATPAGYDAKTAEEIYQEGYEAGLEDCSGYTPTDCSSAITVAYQSGYTEGYAQGQEDCPECSGSTDCSSAITEAYESGYTKGYQSGYTKGYDSGYEDGYEEGEEDCPSLQYQKGYTATTLQATIRPDTGFDGVKRINLDTTPVYNQGYAAGQADCPECSGGSCTLGYGYLELTPQDVEGGPWVVNPSPGSDGFDSFEVADNGYGQQYYDNGYHDGVSSITSGCPMAPKSETLWDIETTIYPDSGYAGMSYVVVDATQVYNAGYRDGGDGCWDTFRQGYESGVTDGFDTGYESGVTDTWPIAYQSGYTDGRGTDCRMQAKSITLTTPYITVYPDFEYAGLSEVSINGGSLYYNGYNAGSGHGYSVGYTNGYTSGRTDGWNSGRQSGFTDGYASGYTDGYGDGYLSGISTTDCSEAAAEAYELGHQSGYTDGWDSGYTKGFNSGKKSSYKEGMNSVIQSFLTGNTLDNGFGKGTVVAYYYTPTGQNCVITGYDNDCSLNPTDIFSSMSVDGGDSETPTLYRYLSAGWHQIRFNVKDRYLQYAFSHNFSASTTAYVDALKAVSIPEPSDLQSGVTALINTFYMNDGIRILSSSIGSSDIGNANIISGATNLNIIISHYKGNDNVEIRSDVQNGVLFYPKGKASTHASTLSGWTHIELF